MRLLRKVNNSECIFTRQDRFEKRNSRRGFHLYLMANVASQLASCFEVVGLFSTRGSMFRSASGRNWSEHYDECSSQYPGNGSQYPLHPSVQAFVT
jgi:hypothetical protein